GAAQRRVRYAGREVGRQLPTGADLPGAGQLRVNAFQQRGL
ncbi:MAG: Glucoamylase, partial [uncultured Rubrobacteraceae bacterium]